jgi:hypothetical protein
MNPNDRAVPQVLSPLVRKIACDHNIDLSKVKGTGMGGRITAQDLAAHLNESPSRGVAAPTSMELVHIARRDPIVGTQPLYLDGREAFFPTALHDAGYEIVITGACKAQVIQNEFFHNYFWTVYVDALSRSFENTYRNQGEAPRGGRHDWLQINGHRFDGAVCLYDLEVLEADYDSHTFRFVVDQPWKPLIIALRMPSHEEGMYYSKMEGNLTVTATSLPEGSLTLRRRRAEASKPKPKEEPAPTIELPKPQRQPETDESYRDRWLRNVERSSDDMTAFLKRVHDGREKQLAQLAAMNLQPESDMYQQYKSEIDNWTAKQIVQFTERKEGDNGSATVIG